MYLSFDYLNAPNNFKSLTMNKFKTIILLLVSSVFTLTQQHPSPSVIQSRLSKGTVIHGNIPYNKDFMWNVTLNYNFRKTFTRIN